MTSSYSRNFLNSYRFSTFVKTHITKNIYLWFVLIKLNETILYEGHITGRPILSIDIHNRLQ